jgi:single-stranded DNA-binding protein
MAAIIQLKVRLGSVETKTAVNGQRYSTIRESRAFYKNGNEADVTVMAFGKARDSVRSLLRKGKTVTVTAQFDGKNLLRILGPAKTAKAA